MTGLVAIGAFLWLFLLLLCIGLGQAAARGDMTVRRALAAEKGWGSRTERRHRRVADVRAGRALKSSAMAGVKVAALTLGVITCAGLGLLAALVWHPESAGKEATLVRVNNGVTEEGRIVVVTNGGHVRRMIVWSTRTGVETQTVEGPIQVRTKIGSPTSLAPFARQSIRTVTVTLPAETVTLPAETLIQTVTQTVPQDTVTETLGRTEVETATQALTEGGSP
jgi:hypothetical protein